MADPPSSPKAPEHIRITTTSTDPEYPGLGSPSRSRSRTHARNSSVAETLLSPTSPPPATPIHRVSTASTTGLRRRAPTNTVKNSKYVTLIPGSEPGLTPEDSRVDLHTHCGITVVDWSQDEIIQTELDNDSLQDFLEEERPEWSKVRWINLNGLSWDCISAVAKKYKLHRLGECIYVPGSILRILAEYDLWSTTGSIN